jgi:O-succinylbenzoate synthase
VRPLFFLGEPLTTRDGYLLAITDDSGSTGYGECAPLAGYSRESGAEALIYLRIAAVRLRNALLNNVHHLSQAKAIASEVDVPSSVLFAVESALLTLGAQLAKKPAASLLNEQYSPTVEINALVESTDNLETRLTTLVAGGCRAVKLKVGRRSLAEDIAGVRQVRTLLPTSVTLRLDANRAWSLDDAVTFARGIRDCQIEYVEEPLTDSSGLADLHRREPQFPLAIDESVRGLSLDQMWSADYVRAVIIKPTIVGGIARTLEIVRVCRESGKTPVISGLIESSLGLAVLAHVASASNLEVPIGLDTARLFASDLIMPALPLKNHVIDIARLYADGFTINRAQIEEVSLE